MKIKYPFPLSDLQIKLFRGPCFGECPVYEVTISGTGEVTYRGDMYVKEVGKREDKVDVLEVLDLYKYAVEIGFFELQAEYESDCQIIIGDKMMVETSGTTMTDQAFCDVTISTGKQTKKVHNYLGSPKRLRQLENRIEKLANTRRWVKF
jgi:hypothetical protein